MQFNLASNITQLSQKTIFYTLFPEFTASPSPKVIFSRRKLSGVEILWLELMPLVVEYQQKKSFEIRVVNYVGFATEQNLGFLASFDFLFIFHICAFHSPRAWP